MDLISMLTSQLGVDDGQAKGGTGLLLKLAKDKLGGDFGKLTEILPDADQLINAAPSGGGGGLGAIGGLLAKFGGSAGKLGDLANIAGGFSKLNMDKGMVTKFIPVVLQFVQDKGGDDLKGLLEKVLK